MRIVFSRKGFDSVAGGGPSPIVNGKPISLPIPDTKGLSHTTYADLGLADLVSRASRGRHDGSSHCHHDPMFLADGTAILGQAGTAQSHLAKQGVTMGDVLLFFGLFAEPDGERHHRIFGYLKIDEIVPLDHCPDAVRERFLRVKHPHAIGMHGANDTLYVGKGAVADKASSRLRLSVEGEPVSLWHRPPWLRRGEMTYFPDRDENWPTPDRMYRVGNGQEFVADIGKRRAPRDWLSQIIAEI